MRLCIIYKVQKIVYPFGIFARSPFLERLAGEFRAFSAMLEVLLCGAIVKSASAAPYTFSHRRRYSAARTLLIRKKFAP